MNQLSVKDQILDVLSQARSFVMQQNTKAIHTFKGDYYVSANIPVLDKLECALKEASTRVELEVPSLGNTYCGKPYCVVCLRTCESTNMSFGKLCNSCVNYLSKTVYLRMDCGASKVEIVRKLKGSFLCKLSLKEVCEFVDHAIKYGW